MHQHSKCGVLEGKTLTCQRIQKRGVFFLPKFMKIGRGHILEHAYNIFGVDKVLPYVMGTSKDCKFKKRSDSRFSMPYKCLTQQGR